MSFTVTWSLRNRSLERESWGSYRYPLPTKWDSLYWRHELLLTLLLAWWHDAQPLCFEPPPSNLWERGRVKRISGTNYTGLMLLGICCVNLSWSKLTFILSWTASAESKAGRTSNWANLIFRMKVFGHPSSFSLSKSLLGFQVLFCFFLFWELFNVVQDMHDFLETINIRIPVHVIFSLELLGLPESLSC